MGIIKNNRKFAGLQVTVHLFNVGFINTYSTCNPQISCYTNMDFSINIKEIFTAFMVLFAVIDITGSTPIIIGLNDAGKKVSAEKAAGISLVIFIAFLFAGDGLLKLFNIDISSFALAGALVLFVLAIEMTFSIEIFRNDGPEGSATIVPVIFPLIAGAGALATTLTLKAECSVFSIIIAILLNMTVVYIVLCNVYLVERVLGKGGVYILRKFFGIILLAMFRIQFKHSAGITILDQKILFGKLFEKIKQESFPKKIFFLSPIEKLFIHLSRFWFLQQGLKGNQVKILNSPAAVSFTESFKHHIATVFQREGA